MQDHPTLTKLFFWGAPLLLLAGCAATGGSDALDPNDTSVDDTGSDGDGDTDTDTDSDTDTDTDADTDTDTDVDTDTDTDTDADSDMDGGADGDADSDTGGPVDTDPDAGADADADGGTDGDTDSDQDTGPEVCETLSLALESVPVRVMLLQDRSGSMNDEVDGTPKWDLAEVAVDNMVTTWAEYIDFGIDFFPAPDIDLECSPTTAVVADCAPDSADAIVNLMQIDAPAERGGRTPLYLAMENYLNSAHAPIFTDDQLESYLVVVSDGRDNCDAPGDRGGHSPDEFAELTQRIVAETGIKIFVIGFGGEADPDELNAIAENGGTAFTTFFDATDGQALEDALDAIGESVHVSCTYDIGEFDPDEVDLDLVNVYFDDTPVPLDSGCAKGQGWSWTDDSRTALEFCKESCDALESNEVSDLSIELACTVNEVVVL